MVSIDFPWIWAWLWSLWLRLMQTITPYLTLLGVFGIFLLAVVLTRLYMLYDVILGQQMFEIATDVRAGRYNYKVRHYDKPYSIDPKQKRLPYSTSYNTHPRWNKKK